MCSMVSLPLDDFDFDLPSSAIAQEPVSPRDAAKLLVLPRQAGPPVHKAFGDLTHLLDSGDLLVINRTQVIPARLLVRRHTGGKGELLLCRPVSGELADARRWEALGRPGSALQPGMEVVTAAGAILRVTARTDMLCEVEADGPIWHILLAEGTLPLPPYISRQGARPADDDDYQSIFACEPGAVAAPTASLHFTQRLLDHLVAKGVEVAEVILHVGPGTFLPIRPEHASDVRKHQMHAERYFVPGKTAEQVARAKDRGKRVVAVGTTALRALETYAQGGVLCGESRLFIYPGYATRLVTSLVTNFHLPRSTLLLLVAALAGRERTMAAYEEALAHGYRFFSYGDAMLIL